MSTVTPQELLKAWKREEMTVEMTLGHVVQNLVKLHTAFVDLRTDVDCLITHTGLPPSTKGRPKPSKLDEMPDPEQPG